MSEAEQKGQAEIDKFRDLVASIGNTEQRQKIMRFASTDRAFLISYPADMTDLEIMDLLAHLCTGFRMQLPQGRMIGLSMGQVPMGGPNT